VFLAADQERPSLAIAEGLEVPGTQITYATGRLFMMLPGLGTLQAEQVPDLTDLNLISIANPRTAPYGVAAMQVLDSLDIAGIDIAYAQNAAGVVAAVKSGAVPAGLTARSLVKTAGASGWEVPLDLYDPIRQDAVLLSRAADNDAAAAFLEWLAGAEAKAIITKHGYDVD
jgi:molybdate transport system substrate-binding protein